MQIAVRREGLSGATHNYTRPVSAFGARELSRRFQEAKQEYGEHVWENRVLQAPGCTEIDKDRLTAYCRQALLHAGMKYEQLKKDPQKEHGVGIRLLLSNYHYRLSYHCGIQNPSVLCYLEGKRMSGDVTADHYRSLSAEEGQRYLQAALNRDKRFQTEGFRQIEETTQDHVTRTVISPPDSRHFTKSRVSVLLQPGDVLECLSPEGLRVNGKVRKEI